MSGLCIAAGKLLVAMPIATFTLAWTHSIEKTRWEEDWQIRDGQLMISEARIAGSGAGMEPPAGALLKNGVWHYRPAKTLNHVLLSHSPYTTGHEFCRQGRCQLLADLLPGIGDYATIKLSACPDEVK